MIWAPNAPIFPPGRTVTHKRPAQAPGPSATGWGPTSAAAGGLIEEMKRKPRKGRFGSPPPVAAELDLTPPAGERGHGRGLGPGPRPDYPPTPTPPARTPRRYKRHRTGL